MAPVAAALRRRSDEVETKVVFTGQHTSLIDGVPWAVAQLRGEAVNLNIMREDQTLYDVVHLALDGLRDIVRGFTPDLVLVQGDTATVFAASLAAFFEKVKVGHVEAGLRSGDKSAPFPEEVLRRLTDVIADLHFAPTPRARDLLLREHAPAGRVHVTGNTVVDALMAVSDELDDIADEGLRGVVDGDQRLVLLTAHRRESFGTPLRHVFAAVRRLVDEVEDVSIVYPVHPNPHVRATAEELLSGHPRIHLCSPLRYTDLIAALRHASLILTDSGGIQEEAPTFGTPVLVLRDVTERPEGIEAGAAELVGTDADRIVARSMHFLSAGERDAPANPYGDGKAGERIADIVIAKLTGRPRTTEDWTP